MANASEPCSTPAGSTSAELLFATPMFSRQLSGTEAVNAHLSKLFLARERSEDRDPRGYSNVGGWHSPIDLQESWDHHVRWVLERCRELAEEATCQVLGVGAGQRLPRFSLSAWANVSREGDYNVPHVHEMTWAAVYYVSVPAQCIETGTGALELLDPRSPASIPDLPSDFFATRRTIVPKPGMIVLFPGALMHFVHPFRGPGERISVACDIGIRTLE